MDNNENRTVRDASSQEECVQSTENLGQDRRYQYTFETEHIALASSALRPKKRRRMGLTVVALCLAFTLVGGAIGGVTTMLLVPGLVSETQDPAPPDGQDGSSADQGGSALVTSPPVSTSNLVSSPSAETLTPRQIFEKCNPSVVGISTETNVNIFGQYVPQASAGSGFIITEDGYVVTNNHVISGASSISVILYDGTEYPAKLVGTDSVTDLAGLKIEATGLSAAVLGDSSTMFEGDPVVAIGNPLGELANSLTGGFISALDRAVNIDGNPQNMLQTDAAVNPGNSGGPLINDRGEVIGVVSAKSSGNAVEGLGFAIPSNDVRPVVEALIENGYVTGRPKMGIDVRTISDSDVRQYGVPHGAYVVSVYSGASQNAGLQQGDIITKLGDREILSVADLSAAKAQYRASDTVEVVVYRYNNQGNSQTLTLTLTFDEDTPAAPTQEEDVAPWRRSTNSASNGL